MPLIRMPLVMPRMQENQTGPLFLLLALNMILLAFFIMLSTMARQQADAQKKHSLETQDGGFESSGSGDVMANDDVDMLDGPRVVRQVQDELRGLVVATLRLPAAPLTADAKGVVLTLPQAAVFETGTARMTPGGQAWAENLVQVLSGTGKGWRGTLVLRGPADKREEAARRVAALGPLAGFDPARLQIGMVEAPGQALMVMRVQAPAGQIADGNSEQVQRVLENGGEAGGLDRVE